MRLSTFCGLHRDTEHLFWLHNQHSRLLGREPCGEPAISLHSYTVSLVQWVNPLLPVMRDPGSIPRGVLMWHRDSPVSIVSLQFHLFSSAPKCTVYIQYIVVVASKFLQKFLTKSFKRNVLKFYMFFVHAVKIYRDKIAIFKTSFVSKSNTYFL